MRFLHTHDRLPLSLYIDLPVGKNTVFAAVCFDVFTLLWLSGVVCVCDEIIRYLRLDSRRGQTSRPMCRGERSHHQSHVDLYTYISI